MAMSQNDDYDPEEELRRQALLNQPTPSPTAAAPAPTGPLPASASAIPTSPPVDERVGPPDEVWTPPSAPATPTPTTTPATTTTTTTPSAVWDATKVSDYFKSRGVEPFPTSVDYWVQKWNEWGSKDPAYFEKRLAEADEFTGVGANYDWQKAGKTDPGTGGTPATGATGNTYNYTNTTDPSIAAFYAAQTAAIQRQQEEDAQIKATMRDSLLRLMQQGQEPVDIQNDKVMGGAASAYRNAARREQTQGRDALAERAAFLGLNLGGQGSGSFEGQLQGQEEGVRQDVAGYEANLAVTELQNRRNMLMQGLQIANALGARTEASSLQRELAVLDTKIKQQQLGYQYDTLGQQQGQFEDSLGLNYNQLLAQMNRDAMLYGG